jgi:hypothetical protein
MTATLSRVRRSLTNVLVPLLAVAVLSAYTAPAFATISVSLQGAHVGASSLTFNNEGDDGGLSAPVVWHFVLNGLDHGTPAGTLTVTFASAGTMTATGIPVGNGSMQHFYVGTPGHDTLTGGSASVDSTDVGNLVLSHVSWDVGEDP